MTIDPLDAYLAALDRHLRGAGRRVRGRFLAEAHAHLADRVSDLERSGVEREEAVSRAVTAFGPAEIVAGHVRDEAAGRSLVLASSVTLACAALFVVPVYLIPENALPPAPWPSADAMPGALAWKQTAVLVAFATAVAAALVGASAGVLARLRGSATRRHAAVTLAPTLFAAASLLVSTVLSAWLAAEWAEQVPGTRTGVLLGVAFPLELGLTLVTVIAVVAVSRRTRLRAATTER